LSDSQNGLKRAREQLRELAEDSQRKRKRLLSKATDRTRLRRILHVTAGVLALLSAASITSIIAELTNSMAVKIFSAALAFISGVITLLISTYMEERETLRMFEGAAGFMSIRDKATISADEAGVTESKAYTELRKLREEYGKCSKEFDPLIGFDEKDLSYDER
jgi:hypothetical protein